VSNRSGFKTCQRPRGQVGAVADQTSGFSQERSGELTKDGQHTIIGADLRRKTPIRRDVW
jgi:hypothetical protein